MKAGQHSPAATSHLELVGRSVRWVRVGGGAGRDRTQLGVELGEPLVFFPQLLVFDPHLLHSPLELDLSLLVVDNGSPVEQLLRRRLRLRQQAPEPRQRGRGGVHGCTT